jgi:small redox-active disulfide protein 2
MKIQVFGTGCEKCTKLYDAVQKVVQKHNLQATVETVSQIDEITAAGVMVTPALGVDGRIVSSGKVLGESDILQLLAPEHAPCCSCQGEVAGQPPNRLKQVITLILLAVVGVSLALMVLREVNRPTATTEAASQQQGTTVYYFYGNQRCVTCNRMEALTQKALEGKDVNYKAVNLDDPANEHYIEDFQLDTHMVVIQRNGRYKKMDEVWERIRGSDEDFIAYIQSGLQDK